MRQLSDLGELSGRRALVTGAAGHIGLAVCETLLELGASMAVVDREAAACRRRVNELSARWGARTLALACDLSRESAIRQTVRAAVRQLGGLDILVHCAAFLGTTNVPGWAVSFERQSASAFRAANDVNVTSAFIMVQEARKALAASGHGSVILFSSIYGMVGPDLQLYTGTPMANPVGYGTSKGGLLQLTRYLATMLAPSIRVNAISPGGVWRRQPKAFHRRYVARTPLRRMATEEDMKGAVAFLASDLSAYVTGHNLVVDGGWTAW